MKIIFVGIHNKPFLTPLCSSTKSGKLIDKVIGELHGYECLKTNLYPTSTMPAKELKHDFAYNWQFRVEPDDCDIIVLLGREVERYFLFKSDRAIKIDHPSSCYGNEEMLEYVDEAVRKIKNILNAETN